MINMLVTLEEMKQYLRVDFADDDSLITYLLSGAEKICMDIMRTDDTNAFASEPNAKTAILYTVAYLYEHREDADHHALVITLRALLFGSRREEF